ncbi:hypothetical protein C8Q76DRAFT_749065 [Earliella scabrosa]|nr:hypothetical protein C8Q76DRAFT_749065 [Earliella scabrosa]
MTSLVGHTAPLMGSRSPTEVHNDNNHEPHSGPPACCAHTCQRARISEQDHMGGGLSVTDPLLIDLEQGPQPHIQPQNHAPVNDSSRAMFACVRIVIGVVFWCAMVPLETTVLFALIAGQILAGVLGALCVIALLWLVLWILAAPFKKTKTVDAEHGDSTVTSEDMKGRVQAANSSGTSGGEEAQVSPETAFCTVICTGMSIVGFMVVAGALVLAVAVTILPEHVLPTSLAPFRILAVGLFAAIATLCLAALYFLLCWL